MGRLNAGLRQALAGIPAAAWRPLPDGRAELAETAYTVVGRQRSPLPVRLIVRRVTLHLPATCPWAADLLAALARLRAHAPSAAASAPTRPLSASGARRQPTGAIEPAAPAPICGLSAAPWRRAPHAGPGASIAAASEPYALNPAP